MSVEIINAAEDKSIDQKKISARAYDYKKKIKNGNAIELKFKTKVYNKNKVDAEGTQIELYTFVSRNGDRSSRKGLYLCKKFSHTATIYGNKRFEVEDFVKISAPSSHGSVKFGYNYYGYLLKVTGNGFSVIKGSNPYIERNAEKLVTARPIDPTQFVDD